MKARSSLEHLTTADWKQWRAQLAGTLDQTTLEEVRERIRPLLGLQRTHPPAGPLAQLQA